MKFNNDYYTANYHGTRDEESKMKICTKDKIELYKSYKKN